MTDSKNVIFRTAEAVANQQDVPWDELHEAHPEEKQGLEKLQKVADLLSNLSPEPTSPERASPQAGGDADWGHLKTLEKIGEGSFGEIFRAFDSILDREVALKLRHADKACGFMSNRGYIQEARRLAKVRHPHVLAVHGVDVHDSRIGIWTDLIEGKNLEQERQERGAFPAEEVMEIGLILCSALDAVHQKGLVHGDIKPSNVMRDAEGHIILMDFGAGSAQDNATDLALATIGTPIFMPPELLMGADPKPSSDLYSLGVLLFVLLCDTYPFEGTSYEGLIREKTAGPPSWPRSVRKKVPLYLRDFVTTLMHPDPGKRPLLDAALDRLKWIQERPKKRLKNLVITAFLLVLITGTVLSSLGFIRAWRSQKKAVEALSRAEAVNTFMQNMFLAADPFEQGDINVKVIDVLDKATETVEHDFADHPLNMANVLDTLGKNYTSLGAFEKGLACFQRVLDIRLNLLGGDDRQTLDAWVEVANDLGHLERFGEAEVIFRDVLPKLEGTLGDDHPDVLAVRNDLAVALMYQTRFEEAAVLFEQVISDANVVLGPTHPHTMYYMTDASRNLTRLGQVSAAETMQRQILEHNQNVLGEDHWETITAMTDLAFTLYHSKKLIEAKSLWEAALEKYRVILGEEHPTTLAVMGDIAAVLSKVGEIEEVETMERKILEKAERSVGSNHPFTINAAHNLAVTLFHRKKLGEALSLQERVWNYRKQTLGDTHMATLQALHHMTMSMLFLKVQDQTETLIRDGIAKSTQSLGNTHPMTLKFMSQLGDMLNENGRSDLVVEWLGTFFDSHPNLLDLDDNSVVELARHLGTAYFKRGRLDESESWMRTCVALSRRTRGDDHSVTQTAIYRLGLVLETKGETEEAIAHYRQAAEKGSDKAKAALERLIPPH